MNATLTPLQRAKLLLPFMSMEEKIAQLNRPNKVSPDLLRTGVGLLMHTTYCSSAMTNVTEVVRSRNDLQRKFLSTGVGARLGAFA